MIEESLFKVNQIGKDGFVWWLGQVAPAKAWKSKVSLCNYKSKDKEAKTWPERCKVRIIGYHSFRKGDLSDEDLPWAHILMDPFVGSAQGGEGGTSNLTGGETCFGFFLDGDDAQQPVVVGLLHRHKMIENLPEDNEFAFQPFTGHPGNVPPTKRNVSPEPSPPKTPPNPPPPTNPPPTPAPTPSPIPSPAPAPTPPSPSPAPSSTLRYQGGTWGFDSPVGNLGIGLTDLFNNNNNFIPYTPKTPLTFADGFSLFNSNAASLAFDQRMTFTYTPPSECHNNFIGQITQILQDFIGFTNSLQKFAGTYINPVLNEVVDITNSIKSIANSIGGIIRMVVNSIRSGLIKCILKLFSIFKGTLSLSGFMQTVVGKAIKKIIDILYCLFEKLMPIILQLIEKFITDLVDSVFSAPICAIEQFVAGILTEVMKTIEEAIEPLLSGINALTGGLSKVFDAMNQASSLASQIYSFIGCDSLKCTTPSKWVSNMGPSEMEADNWQKMVDNVNVFNNVATGLQSVEQAIAGSSFYNQTNFPFDYSRCNEDVNNPTRQEDLAINLPGNILFNCIPPIISVYSGNEPPLAKAELFPQISDDGKFISVDIIKGGLGYTKPPTLTVIDNSGYGSGAILQARIDKNGSIKRVLIVEQGSGYCKATPLGTLDTLGEEEEDDDINDRCPNEEDAVPKNDRFRLSVKSNKNRIYEGESFKIQVKTNNEYKPKRVKYKIEGVTSSDINQNMEGYLKFNDKLAEITIETIPNEIKDTKKLKFNLSNYNKFVDVIIDDISESLPNKKYKLVSNISSINEGAPFRITLKTKNVPDGTIIPFKIYGVSEGLIKNKSSYVNFVVNNNISMLKFDTNKGIIQDNELFELILDNDEARVSVLINRIAEPEPNTQTTICVSELVVIRPGIGYNVTDTATDGINTYDLIISPDNGAIFGVKALAQANCGFTDIPIITINTNTGIGAEILPITITDTNPSSSTSTTTPGQGVDVTETNEGTLKIVDCI